MSASDLGVSPATTGRHRGAWRWWADSLVFYAVLAGLGLTFLGWSLPAAAVAPLARGPRSRSLGRAAISGAFRFWLGAMQRLGLVRLDLSALDGLRDLRGAVVAANHLSLIDAVLVVSRLPEAVCLMKGSLDSNPLLGGARLAGYLRNDSPLAVVRGAAAALRSGANLLVFPEGTRGAPGRPGPFRPGFALIARAAGAPVVAVLLESDTPYLGKGWPVWRRPEFPLTYRARLLGTFRVEGAAEAFGEGLRALYGEAVGAPRRAAPA